MDENIKYNPKKEVKLNGVLRTPPYKMDEKGKKKSMMSIRDFDYLQRLFELLIGSSLGFPVQPVLVNFGMLNNNTENLQYFYNYYNSIRSYEDRDKIGFAALALVKEFELIINNRNTYFSAIKVIAYHFKLRLDLRNINHNYSMIYQIIADINHRTFGNNFLAVYFITKPSSSVRDPEIEVEIIISNPSIFSNKLLSTNMEDHNFTEMGSNTFGAVNRIYSEGIRNSNENNMPVYRVFDTPDDDIYVKPANYKTLPGHSYRELYESLFGPEIYSILPKEATHMKPGYFPDTEDINKKRREKRFIKKNTESWYLDH